VTTFDFEPEDAWDALDPPGVQIRNLARRLRLVDGRPDPPDDEPDDMLDALEARIAAAAGRLLEARQRHRLEQAALDLIYVRARL
jgi:hypothetical protein